MNILVTGADGQLGRSLRIAARDSRDNYIYTDVAQLDITNEHAVEKFIDENGIELVINCAAYTNVDKAESEPEAARRINTEAPGILARAMRRHDGAIIHISTDYVFGGILVNTPITETETPSPLGVYGKTKLDGEWEVTEANPRYVIIRTAWLYSEYGHNFVRTMLSLTATHPKVTVVIDQAGSPTYAADLARAVVAIADARGWEKHPGIYHYSDEGICSWYDVARRVAVSEGRDGVVVPCRSSQYPSPVTRPAYSALDKTLIKETFGVDVPYWTDSLDLCLRNLRDMQ